MDRRQIGLQLALDVIGVELSVGNFDKRLALQKAVYLVQQAGVRLGYSFRWYIRGPYSPSLADDAFAVTAEREQGSDDARGWKLDAHSARILDPLRPLFQAAPGETLAAKLERLASVHFLRYSPQGRGLSIPQLREALAASKKDYTEDQVREALEELARHGLDPAPAA